VPDCGGECRRTTPLLTKRPLDIRGSVTVLAALGSRDDNGRVLGGRACLAVNTALVVRCTQMYQPTTTTIHHQLQSIGV